MDGPGRWVLALDFSVELCPSHVLLLPPDLMDASGVLQWLTAMQTLAAGSA